MLVLVTYDVNTETDKKRLRQVAKFCVKYGQRVQNSVFECVVDAATYRLMKHQLLSIIDVKKDSLRFYNLGKNYKEKTEHYGIKLGIDMEGVIMI